jgi:pregnancy-associated plasma protein-A
VAPLRRTCGTMEAHKRLIKTDPIYRENRMAIESFTAARMAAKAAKPKIVKIPVVVHVVYATNAENISDAQVKSQIAVLNRDYRKKNKDVSKIPAPFKSLAADARIEFALATRAPNGSPTNGITRTRTQKQQFDSQQNDIKFATTGGHDAWPRDQYLNLWTAKTVIDPQMGALLGYAQFPGGPTATDGVVISSDAFGTKGTAKSPFDLGRTATHEIGHWLNLLHIWGDDMGGCSGSDNVPDTPNQADHNFGKPAFPHVTCANGPDGDMFMNYMDYVDDDTMFMFTSGQVDRMHATLHGPRASVLVSNGLDKAAKTAHVTIPVPKSIAKRRRALVRTADRGATRVFDGVGWVPITAALRQHSR